MITHCNECKSCYNEFQAHCSDNQACCNDKLQYRKVNNLSLLTAAEANLSTTSVICLNQPKHKPNQSLLVVARAILAVVSTHGSDQQSLITICAYQQNQFITT